MVFTSVSVVSLNFLVSNFPSNSASGPFTCLIYRNVTVPVYTTLKGVRGHFIFSIKEIMRRVATMLKVTRDNTEQTRGLVNARETCGVTDATHTHTW